MGRRIGTLPGEWTQTVLPEVPAGANALGARCAGMVNPASTVLTSGSGVLSMPLRVTTLGTQALTAQLVGTGMEGTTQGQPLSLLQV